MSNKMGKIVMFQHKMGYINQELKKFYTFAPLFKKMQKVRSYD
jgi:hypothetical protein